MSKVLAISSAASVGAVGVSRWQSIGNGGIKSSGGATTEVQQQMVFRNPGTFSSMTYRLAANSLNQTLTSRSRKNTANGNLTASIAAGITGEFSDLTHSDTVASGDIWNGQLSSPAGTGNFTVSVFAVIFDASGIGNGLSVTQMTCNNGDNNTAPSTEYFALSGIQVDASLTESDAQMKARFAGTLMNFLWTTTLNGRTDTTTVGTRINGVDGTLKISINSGQTGTLEDIAHTDPVKAGDLVCQYNTIGSGTGTSAFTLAGCDLTNNFGQWIAACSLVGGTGGTPGGVINANTTVYNAIGGEIGKSASSPSTTTESDVKVTSYLAFTASNLGVNVIANTVSAASTQALRVNGATSALSASITASTTGIFEDTTHSVSVLATDQINYITVTGATGTSMTVTGMWMQGTTPTTPVDWSVEPVCANANDTWNVIIA